MTNNFNYLYNEMKVVFEKRESEGVAYINATQMGKIFNKQPKDWLKTDLAKSYINAISGRTKILPTDLVIVRNGGNNFGTWLHQDLAIEFAGWLDINFKLWCTDRIKEIFQYGLTGTDEAIEKAVMDPDFMIGVLQNLKEAREKLKEQQPKVEYYDKVLETKNTFNITEIAQELGLTSIKLNKILQEKGVQHKVGNMWCLTKDYLDKGYADVSTYLIISPNGNETTRHHLKRTEKGRELIHNLIKDE